MDDLLIRSVRLWPREPGGTLVDVSIRDGRIAAIGAGLAESPGVASVDGEGGVLMPALADVHTHSTRPGSV